MIKKLREREEGFTLAELLIVVAIIAVLVAIAIPVFNSQLNKSKYATDVANARSIYADLSADYLANSGKAQEASVLTGVTSGEEKILSAGDKITIKTGSNDNDYEFNGVSKITVTLGTADKGPKVEIAPTGSYGDEKTFGK